MWCEKVLAQVVECTLIEWEDLGLSPMYANCVYLIYYYFDNIFVTSEWYYNYRIIIAIPKHELAKWLCFGLMSGESQVQILLDMK